MQESRQRCVQFVFPVGHSQFVLASGRLQNLICVAIRPSRRRLSSADGQQWRSVTSSLGSHIERLRSLNILSFVHLGTSLTTHGVPFSCSLLVHRWANERRLLDYVAIRIGTSESIACTCDVFVSSTGNFNVFI